jgi:predicted RND superfamily exporter protein
VIARLAAAVIDHRLVAWCTVVAVLVAAGLGLSRLHVDFSSTGFYGNDDESAATLRAFVAEFGPDDATALVVLRDVDEPVLGTEERRAAVSELAAALAERPRVRRVLDPGSAIAALPGMPRLASDDGSSAAILIELEESSNNMEKMAPIVADLDRLLTDHPTAERFGAQLAGVPAIRAAFFDLTWHDQARFVPLTLLIIGLGLGFAFRRVHAVVIAGISAAVPTFVLIGILGWWGEPIGILNQAYMTLLPVLAVANAIHLISRTHEIARLAATESEHSPVSRRIVVDALAAAGPACTLSALTTGLGFASLGFAEMPILRSFGSFAGLGMLVCGISSLTLVPLLLSHVSPDSLRAPARRSIASAISAPAVRRPGLTLALTALLAIAAGFASSRVVIDNTLTGLLRADHPAAIASRTVDRELGGILALEVWVRAAEGEFEGLENFEAWSESDTGITDLVHHPPRGDHQRLTLRSADEGAIAFAELTTRVEEATARLMPGLVVDITGTSKLAYEGVNRITEDLRRSLLAVLIIVVSLTGVLFRSPRLALLAIPTNALPLLLGYAALGVLGIVLDPMSAVILTMALGVAVDDSIHLLARARQEASPTTDTRAALRAAIAGSGTAITLTSLVLAAGLCVNLLSSFTPLIMLGGLGAAVIVFAWLADLVVLPALVLRFGGLGLTQGSHLGRNPNAEQHDGVE